MIPQRGCYHFIVNPKSGSSVEVGLVRQVLDYLRRQGRPIRLTLTESLAHAGALARRAVRQQAAAVVVRGGDGTVRTVAEGMAASRIPILILPGGTENLLAQELGIDGSWPTTLRMLEEGTLRPLDLGRVNGRCFMAIVGVGFDAQVVRRIHAQRSGHITHTDYVWPICRTFWEYGPPTLRVEVDGERICDEPGLVFVGNISRYAVGLPVVPGSDCSDGLFQVTIYRYRRRRQLLGHAVRTTLRRAQRSDRVSYHRGRHIRISGSPPATPVQLDGDPGPKLPLEIDILPAAARVLTPKAPAGQAVHPPVRLYHLRRWLFH
ncbi:MAG: diacylglycerol kinase family lipid kinase [Sedimentisphaerales bacterium]|nr:diacylglycerol kinase family lipid kinase [Sedimentisphaerales bacterium]